MNESKQRVETAIPLTVKRWVFDVPMPQVSHVGRRYDRLVNRYHLGEGEAIVFVNRRRTRVRLLWHGRGRAGGVLCFRGGERGNVVGELVAAAAELCAALTRDAARAGLTQSIRVELLP